MNVGLGGFELGVYEERVALNNNNTTTLTTLHHHTYTHNIYNH